MEAAGQQPCATAAGRVVPIATWPEEVYDDSKSSQRVKIRREEFGSLIFTNRTPILALNQDARVIWDLVDGRRTVAEITQILATPYGERAQRVSPSGRVHSVMCRTRTDGNHHR